MLMVSNISLNWVYMMIIVSYEKATIAKLILTIKKKPGILMFLQNVTS